ncbi:uncharacterized protein K02A2.6-like [Tigriopus californicus]|uniref:uncharacterized protein K02A2.6-like n=1 Tax=Tigriopus californicus TaxID=6832 RepID=UPI0027DA5D39|nr:uncharacterized protein K02A2.6-like [Tigriopus californicus]
MSDLSLENLGKIAQNCPKYGRLKSAVEKDLVGKTNDDYVSLFKKVFNKLSVDGPLVLQGASLGLIRELRPIYATMGVPNVFQSDNGTPFASSMTRDFFQQWGIEWRPLSPHHPQSNGHAETNVKSLKHLLAKCGGELGSDEFLSGLLELRNTLRTDGLSLAQRLFGHPLRSKLPVQWRAFLPEFQVQLDMADVQRLCDD